MKIYMIKILLFHGGNSDTILHLLPQPTKGSPLIGITPSKKLRVYSSYLANQEFEIDDSFLGCVKKWESMEQTKFPNCID
jgi:hypothetical protein